MQIMNNTMAMYLDNTRHMFGDLYSDSGGACRPPPANPWRADVDADTTADADDLLAAINMATTQVPEPITSTTSSSSCWSPDAGDRARWGSNDGSTATSDYPPSEPRPDSARSASDAAASPFNDSVAWSPARRPMGRDSVSYGSYGAAWPPAQDTLQHTFNRLPNETCTRADAELKIIQDLVKMKVYDECEQSSTSVQPRSAATFIEMPAHQRPARPSMQRQSPAWSTPPMPPPPPHVFAEQLYAFMLANGPMPPPNMHRANPTHTPATMPLPPLMTAVGTHPAAPPQSSPVGELHAAIEACADEYRCVERERKKTEAELARQHLGKRINSMNNMAIPRLPPQPSRLDRLIVDYYREHARVVTLLGKMQWLTTSALPTRVHQTAQEWHTALKAVHQARAAQRAMHPVADTALVPMVTALTAAVRRARAASWCSLMTTLHMDTGLPDHVQATVDAIRASDYNQAPPPIQINLKAVVAAAAAAPKTTTPPATSTTPRAMSESG